MANALDTIAPKILARGMLAFRDQAFFPRLVNHGFSAEAAQKGDTIDIMLPGEVAVEDVEPGSVAPTPPDVTAKTFSLKMQHWKKVAFHLTDKEMMQVDADQYFIPFQMNEAIAALASTINQSFLEKVVFATHAVGMASETLFTDQDNRASFDHYRTNPAIACRKKLNLAKAPRTGRYAVIGYGDESQAVKLSEFLDWDKSNDAAVMAEGLLGRKFGFDWYATDPLHVHQSTSSDSNRLRGNMKTGATSLTMGGISRQPVPGDVLTDYTGKTIGILKENTDGAGTAIQTWKLFSPLDRNHTNNIVIKFSPTHSNGIAFQKNAFAFAMRPLAGATQEYGLGNRILSVTDPVSGLSLRLEISRQYKQTVWEFDALWGVELARPEFAVRLLTDN